MTTCPDSWVLLRAAWDTGGEASEFLHTLECERCHRMLSTFREDRAVARTQLATGAPPTAMLSGGLALSVAGFQLHRPAPVFRAGGIPVLHSAIHPLERDYVLLELSGWDGDLELHLERGTKNGPSIPISLYMDEELSDQRKLQTRLSYRLTQLAAGQYQLKLREHTVFQFNVRE